MWWPESRDANNADPTGTLGLGSLARLRDEARQAKERLSAETATVVPAELPGFNSDVRVTRNELENLIAEPLAGLLNAIEETLQRNNIPVANVSAVATVGGGANIPRVTQQLSERLRAPVVTTPQSQLNVAAGAALMADRGLEADAPTGMAPTGLAAAADAPTGMAAAGWAAGAAGLAASESASDGAPSATFRALAWSQDDAPGGEPVPYSGEDYTFDQGPTDARPQVAFAHEEEGYEPEPGPLPWYKRPPILFGAAAAAVLLAIGGLAVTLTSTSGSTGPVTETATHVETGPSPGQPPTSATAADDHGHRTQRRAEHHGGAAAPAIEHDHDVAHDHHDHNHHNHNHNHHDDNDHDNAADHHDDTAHYHPSRTTTQQVTTTTAAALSPMRRPLSRDPWRDRRQDPLTDIPPAARDTVATLLAAPTAPVKVLVSGGIGTGKSSVLAAIRSALREAEVAVLTRPPRDGDDSAAAVVIDDAHLLDDAELGRLGELVADPASTVVVAAEPLAHHAALRSLVVTIERENPMVSLGALSPADVNRTGDRNTRCPNDFRDRPVADGGDGRPAVPAAARDRRGRVTRWRGACDWRSCRPPSSR